MQQILTAIRNNEITHELLEGLTDYGKALIAFPFAQLFIWVYVNNFCDTYPEIEDELYEQITRMAQQNRLGADPYNFFHTKGYRKRKIFQPDYEHIISESDLDTISSLLKRIRPKNQIIKLLIEKECHKAISNLLKLKHLSDCLNTFNDLCSESKKQTDNFQGAVLPAILEIANHHHKAKEHYLLKITELLRGRQHLITHAVHHQQSNLNEALF